MIIKNDDNHVNDETVTIFLMIFSGGSFIYDNPEIMYGSSYASLY